MTYQMIIDEEREEARGQGHAEGHAEGRAEERERMAGIMLCHLSKNGSALDEDSLREIAEETELDLERIKAIAKSL